MITKKDTFIVWLIALAIFILISVAYIKGCAYLPIEGTVVDAETGKPIEGAVVLAEWTITKGRFIGFDATESYKAIEDVTNTNGEFKINGSVLKPFVNEPRLIIYKAGYICWDNKFLFPDYKKRIDYKWQSGNIFKLERFNEEIYSHKAHITFIYAPSAGSNLIPHYYEAIRFEQAMMQRETEVK